MDIQSDSKVGELAGALPLATRVFSRHGIDFCCGGGVSLADACAKRGLDIEAVIGDIRAEVDQAPQSSRPWGTAPLAQLIDHILEAYHVPLKEELPRLLAMAEKVYRVHGEKDPEGLKGLLDTLRALSEELTSHMLKEERVLFPMIRDGRGAQAGGPIDAMEHEHESAGAALRRLRELTDNYQAPAGACNTWCALWAGLEALEMSLHEHIHLENNILFPRSLAS